MNYGLAMIVWINGPFGVGKTTTANALLGRDGWRLIGPEHVGFLLPATCGIKSSGTARTFPPWRVLVPAVADEIYRFTSPSAMVAVQTVLVAHDWEDLVGGFGDRGLPIFHVLLDCDENELRRRITADEVERQALEWRLDHIAKFQSARSWIADEADLVLDTSDVGPEAAADSIADALTAVLASDA